MIKPTNGLEYVGIESKTNKKYVKGPGNHIDFKGNGNGFRIYVPKNENLKPVTDILMSDANGSCKVFEGCAGEDVPIEILIHSHKFSVDDGVITYGVTGADLALDALYSNDLRRDRNLPKEFDDFFLFNGDEDSTRYEDPALIFNALIDMREKGEKLGIMSDDGYVFFLDPLNYGKLPDFCILGPMTESLLDVYDNLVSKNDIEISAEKMKRYLEDIRQKVDALPGGDREYFLSKPFNEESAIRLRVLGRKLCKTSPEAAAAFFESAIEPYKGKNCDVFAENRFSNLTKAAVQHHLVPLGIDIGDWQFRTRAVESAQFRHYTEDETSKGKGAVHKAFTFEIVETAKNATLKNLEPYKSIGKVTPVREHVEKIN